MPPPRPNTERPSSLPIAYALPETVEALRTGWRDTCTSAAVVSSLLAAVAASLLAAINDDYDSVETISQGLHSYLYILSFAAILFNVSATMSSVLIIDELSGLIGKEGSEPPKEGDTTYGVYTLLERFGLSTTWKWMVMHWISCLLLGMWSVFMQVVLFAWVSEKTTLAVRVTITCAAVYAAVPMVLLGPFKSCCKFAKKLIQGCRDK